MVKGLPAAVLPTLLFSLYIKKQILLIMRLKYEYTLNATIIICNKETNVALNVELLKTLENTESVANCFRNEDARVFRCQMNVKRQIIGLFKTASNSSYLALFCSCIILKYFLTHLADPLDSQRI